MACLECLRDIDAVHVFAALLFECHLIHDFHAEVVQDHSAPDFLDDKFALAGPELLRSQGMLQVAEGGLDASLNLCNNVGNASSESLPHCWI